LTQACLRRFINNQISQLSPLDVPPKFSCCSATRRVTPKVCHVATDPGGFGARAQLLDTSSRRSPQSRSCMTMSRKPERGWKRRDTPSYTNVRSNPALIPNTLDLDSMECRCLSIQLPLMMKSSDITRLLLKARDHP
jgi:hypothetical protein